METFPFFNTVFFTLLLFCAFIAFAQWRLTNDKIVVWYIGYLLCTFAHYGRQFWLSGALELGFVFPPDPPLRWDTPLSYAAFACYFLFIEGMMDCRDQAPRFSRILLMIARLFTWMIGVNLMLQLLLSDSAAQKVHTVFQALVFPVFLGVMVILPRYSRFFYQKLILIGTFALVVGYICAIATRQFEVWHEFVRDVIRCFPTPWGDVCLYHLRVGIIIDVVCFSWALTIRQKALLVEAISAAKPVRAIAPVGIPPNSEPVEDAFLQKVIEFLNHNYTNDQIKVEAVAKAVSLSADQTNRKLKSKTGLTTEQYMLQYRLARALELLRTTDKTISEITYAVGLKDPAHFSRAFKRQYGLNPNEIRKTV